MEIKFLITLSALCLCANISLASMQTYRAGIIEVPYNGVGLNDHIPIIHEAGKSNVDILVLPPGVSGSEDNYDEIVKNLSKSAKDAGLYIVAHLYEMTRCQNKNEMIRSNLVFDRQGAIVSVKPLNNIANCTAPTSESVTFTADFGVTFGVLMEEDVVLKGVKCLKDLKNFVLTGAWSSEIPFLTASRFSSTWAYIADANLVSSSGIYAGRAGAKTGVGRLRVVELNKNPEGNLATPPVVNPDRLENFPGEDLNQYIIRPLDVEASSNGYEKTICHGSFCCQFYVKTRFNASKQGEISYGLAVFDGVRHFGHRHYIGAQNCAVFACAGLYKRTCTFGSVNNSTNITFEKLSVSGNFTKFNSDQYPVVLTDESLSTDRFSYVTKSHRNTEQVTIGLSDSNSLLSFGIFGRDYSKDYENYEVSRNSNESGMTSDIYDYIFNDDVQEVFDYLWIRIRILMFVVSIYILEMM